MTTHTHLCFLWTVTFCLTLTEFLLSPFSTCLAAEDLQLKPGIAFNQDVDNGFPIIGKRLEDARIEAGEPVLLFFGAPGDLNTNRQAKRIVELYRKLPATKLKFIIIDVDHPLNEESKGLIKMYYKGYIPFELLLDQSGKLAWSQIGEVQITVLKKKIDAVLK